VHARGSVLIATDEAGGAEDGDAHAWGIPGRWLPCTGWVCRLPRSSGIQFYRRCPAISGALDRVGISGMI
jgi:hypothetical protein